MHLKNKFFIALLSLTLIPLLVLLFGVANTMETELLARKEAEVRVALEQMISELDSLLNHQKSIAKGLSRVPAVKSFAAVAGLADSRSYQQSADELEGFFLNYQRAVPSIQALRFIGSGGKTLVKVKEGKPIEATRLDPTNKRLYVADQSNKVFFKRAIVANKNVTMSDFELGQVSPDADFCPAMIRYSVQIKDELDQIEGLLVVNMWGTRFDKTIQAVMGGYSGTAYMVEVNQINNYRNGIYLYHKNRDYRFSNQTDFKYRFTSLVTNKDWQKIKNSTNGLITGDNGKLYFYKKFQPFQNINNINWLLIIEINEDNMLGPVNNMRQSIRYLLIIVFIVSMLLAIWAAIRLTTPVRKLADMLTRYADGDHSVRYDGMSKDEIGVAGRAFNYLADSLKRAKQEKDKAEKIARQSDRLAAVGKMAAGIGHEINNPLMNIMSLASLLDKNLHENDLQSKKDILLLMKEGRRCARIVQGILNFARENHPEFRSFNMTILLKDTVGLLQHRLEAQDITINMDVEKILLMDGDPNLLQQVLVNILLNAIQASASRTEIKISAKINNGHIEILINDEGKGINDENISQVFDPFFTTKSEGEGTGLGLSVSYGIIKHHGGIIGIDNVSGKGVTVTIILPQQHQVEHEIDKELVNAI